MNFSPKVRDWVKREYFELKELGDVDIADLEKLLGSPEVKKLWTSLGPRKLVAESNRTSANKLFHLANAIAVARQGIPPDERVPRTTKEPAARKVREAAGKLKLAWEEMRKLSGGEIPRTVVSSICQVSQHLGSDFERDFTARNAGTPISLPEAVPASVHAALAIDYGYSNIELLMESIIEGVKAWPVQPVLVPKPAAQDADRLYFYRKLASELRTQYGARSMSSEAREVMAELYNSGPQNASAIDEFPPAKITRSGRSYEK